jgi:hypothetical protein
MLATRLSGKLAFGAEIPKQRAEGNDYHCEPDVDPHALIAAKSLDDDKDRTDTREANMHETCEAGR